MGGVDDVDDVAVKRAFGRRVRELREHAELNQDQLAALVGQSERNIRSLESGETGTPLVESVRLAAALGVSLPELMDLSDLPRFDTEHRRALRKLVRTAREADPDTIDLTRKLLKAVLTFLKARGGG